MQKLIIPLPLMTLNEYTNEQRRNRYIGNKAKQRCTDKCRIYAVKAMREGLKANVPLVIEFNWYCANKKQDPDNIAFQQKFILDGMVKAGLIENDGWKQISKLVHHFEVDKNNPRVEIILNEYKAI